MTSNQTPSPEVFCIKCGYAGIITKNGLHRRPDGSECGYIARPVKHQTPSPEAVEAAIDAFTYSMVRNTTDGNNAATKKAMQAALTAAMPFMQPQWNTSSNPQLDAAVEALRAVLETSGARGKYHALKYTEAVAKAEDILTKIDAGRECDA